MALPWARSSGSSRRFEATAVNRRGGRRDQIDGERLILSVPIINSLAQAALRQV